MLRRQCFLLSFVAVLLVACGIQAMAGLFSIRMASHAHTTAEVNLVRQLS